MITFSVTIQEESDGTVAIHVKSDPAILTKKEHGTALNLKAMIEEFVNSHAKEQGLDIYIKEPVKLTNN